METWMTLQRFVEIWTSRDYPPAQVAEADLQDIERGLGVRFPKDYRNAVLQTGLPRPTAALLNAIVERDLDLRDVADFFQPQEILEETVTWRKLGMPEQFVAFASDGGGNKFCFDADLIRSDSPEGQAVWLYDHDFGTTDQVALSFTMWIEELCGVEPADGDSWA